jgi:death-on-curing protein
VSQTRFLSLHEVLAIHADQVKKFGGEPGVRDMGLLESAITQAFAGFGDHLAHPDLISQASAYLFHLVKNHPFVDGNKRTGAACALIFLHLNHCEINATNEALVNLTLGVAEGKLDKSAIVRFFQDGFRSP